MATFLRVWLDRLDRWGTAAENLILILLLTGMIVLGVGQIILSKRFDIGFVWVGGLIKLLVLWIAIVASVAAARSDRHLRIDALSHFVSAKYARYPRVIVDSFASGMCFFLTWYAIKYLQIVGDDVVLGVIPKWLAHGVVPVALFLMGYRFLVLAGKGFAGILANADEEPTK